DEAGELGVMLSRQSKCDDGAPGMADDHRPLDAKLLEGFVEQFGLPIRRPDPASRAVAVTEARPIEGDDPMLLGHQEVGDTARVPVGPGHGVAVDQHDRTAVAAVAVVKPDAVHLDERALRRMSALGTASDQMIAD